MKVLHTEASSGFGGQEIRILREAQGLRARGHEIIMAIKRGGGLVQAARDEGFHVYELEFEKRRSFQDLIRLLSILRRHKIQIINTHSSWDAWLAGIAGKVSRTKVLRTRHLSTPIRTGWNSRMLYRRLADKVVTTCETTAEVIRQQAAVDNKRCWSVPTGVDPQLVQAAPQEAEQFRKEHGIASDEILVGTVCVLRSWKGISTMLRAAQRLLQQPKIRWIVVGDGPARDYFRRQHLELGLDKRFLFSGYIAQPYAALAAMDMFLMLSTANEGVSQAVLQAAYLGKPLITTTVGGLPEVCIEGVTGKLCSVDNAQEVAQAVQELTVDSALRNSMGKAAHELVNKQFTLNKMLDEMELTYQELVRSLC